MDERTQSIYEHIEELRKRIIITFAFFVLSLFGGLFLAKPIILFLQQAPVAQDIPMNAFHLVDPLKVYFQFAFLIAFIVTSPVILYQLWAFIAPGLYENERKVTLSYIPAAVLLFAAGLSFAYFVLFPYIVHFVGNLAESLNIQEMYGINQYFSFLFQLTLPFGFLFQLPVIVMFFTRLGILSPGLLVKSRRIAYFVLLVIAGVITPPDLLSHMMVTLPLLLLYEFSIIVSRYAYRKRLEAEAKQQLEEQMETSE
ncbi:twin-arginine translocase subunit TatC [Pseudalkalibacillus caeni]|uniref:Sec-independent protein translocase protein TatC n=1 Tax=Exobacillus caeni TaxID=2574798 RepID=A0A5R9F655_9BACL|nr:twin-arginine translocase subunit TatC [Pseudalkalibacillus caeni]TLS35285.1 twin-arginine translocase subunit TatC [Pseudalkalibacillus caeni]